jgi:sugar/nucleoside kinase (ribokinase family)
MDMPRYWMGFYKKWVGSRYNEIEVLDAKDNHALFEEVGIARKEWSEAQLRLDWAIGKDHIDYSIYALEAAEKRYEMLLRLAKQKKWEFTLSI